MRYLSATLESPISLSYEVDPEMVCGGVWVEDEKRFVPVAPRRNADGGIDVYNDAEFGHSIIDYVEVGPDGAPLAEERVRANVLSVPAGHSSPAWEIKKTAEGYDEYHHTVEGNGDFSHWVPDGQDGKERTDTPLPRLPGETTHVTPGDIFKVRAGSVGVHVLAVFINRPFDLAFERRVPDPV